MCVGIAHITSTATSSLLNTICHRCFGLSRTRVTINSPLSPPFVTETGHLATTSRSANATRRKTS